MLLAGALSGRNLLAKAHKNLDFVLEKPENGGPEGQKRTKTPILCSKCLKTGVPKAKSAQKPRFCARNARKWGFRRQKAHKNLDFVLEMPENEGSEGQKRTKMPILCSGGARSRELFREEPGAGWPPRGTRRRGGAAEMEAPRRCCRNGSAAA